MKAEDMPSGLVGSICCAGYGVHSENCPRVLLHAAQRDLAAQTATAQSLRLIVERAVEYAMHKTDCDKVQVLLRRFPPEPEAIPCTCGLDAFLAEIGARSAEAIQERKE